MNSTLLFALRLPELIDPAKAVLGGEDLDRQVGDQFLQRPFVLRRKADLEHRIVRAVSQRFDVVRFPKAFSSTISRL